VTTRPLIHRVLRRDKLPAQKRCIIANGYIMSKGLFQCGTWPQLQPVEYKAIHQSTMRVFRPIADTYDGYGCNPPSTSQWGTQLGDMEVVTRLGVLLPHMMISLARVALFIRLISNRNDEVLRLLAVAHEAEHSWLNALEQDLLFLETSTEFASSVPRPEHDVAKRWTIMIVNRPADVKRRVKKALHEHDMKEKSIMAMPPMCQREVVPTSCTECDRVFLSHQRMTSHRARTHGFLHPHEIFIADGLTHCEVCMVSFHTRARVLTHVGKSQVCRCNLLLRGPRVTEERARVLATEELSNRRLLRMRGNAGPAGHRAVSCPGPFAPILTTMAVTGNQHPMGIGHKRHTG
jgi:hypothetical protein